MIKIEVTSRPGNDEKIRGFLKEKEVSFVFSQVQSDAGELLYRYVVISTDETAPSVIEFLTNNLTFREKSLWLTKSTPDAVVSEFADKAPAEEKPERQIPKIIEEVEPQVEPFTKLHSDLLAMVLLAALVALSGLLLNHSSVVLGAMLISPMLGPITAFSFYAAIGGFERMVLAGRSGAYLLGAVIMASAVASFIVTRFYEIEITPEILLRIEVSPFDVVVGVLLGFAGGVAILSTLPGMLVGVAIAAALVPPAVVSGLGIALLDYQIFIGALIETLSNVVGLVLGCVVVFYLKGISPRTYWEKKIAEKYVRNAVLVFLAMCILLAVLSAVLPKYLKVLQ